jgi:hypothetical protein
LLAQGICQARTVLTQVIYLNAMRSFLLALPLLAFPGVVSQSVKSCGGPNDHLKNPVIKLTPDPPVKGGALTIEVTGMLDEVEGDFRQHVDIEIVALGFVHASVKGDVPLTISPGAVAGPFSATVGPFSIPSNVPGSLSVKGQAHVVNAKNEPIMCIDLDLNVPGADDVEAPDLTALASWATALTANADHVSAQMETPTLTALPQSCGKPTDHLSDLKITNSGGVYSVAGTLDEAVTKATIDLDASLRVLFISIPFKMSIPLSLSNGLVKKGAYKSTVGPSSIVISPNVKFHLKGTMKVKDGNGEEITCLNVGRAVAADDTHILV